VGTGPVNDAKVVAVAEPDLFSRRQGATVVKSPADDSVEANQASLAFGKDGTRDTRHADANRKVNRYLFVLLYDDFTVIPGSLRQLESHVATVAPSQESF